MQKINSVITGANGFVGSHLVDYLLEKNHTIKCIVRKSSNTKWLDGKPVEIFRCGLDDKNSLIDIIKDADYIFHIAGVVKSKTKEGYYKGNVDATKNLLEAALESRTTFKRIVVISSQAAAGPSYDGNPVDESMENHPITTYGKSKNEQEKLTKTFMDKLPITICRPPSVYGERDTEIFIFFKTFNNGLMPVIGFDKKLVSLIYVKDLVEGIYLASINDKAKGEIFFITSSKFYSWDEIGEITKKILKKKVIKLNIPHFIVYLVATFAEFFSLFSKNAPTLNIEKGRDITQRYWICSSKKANEILGFKEKYSIEEGFRNTINWYKEMKWL